VLTVRGRVSGKPYSTPVDAIEHDGRRWLVAPYGVTNWVRNARAAGEVELRRGDRIERMRVREASSDEAVPILRHYLEVVPVTRPYFDVGPDATEETLAAEVERHPVFQLEALS
jgi:deazaflavin-dependent oxidoreductase (nitroreductase family)